MTASRFCSIMMVVMALTATGCHRHPAGEQSQSVLKIGTIHRVKTDNILFDDALGLFSIISHPPLIELRQGGKFEGILAEQFAFSENYKVWTLKLKPHLYWSDGEPVTAEDVRFTLRYKSRHLPTRKWIKRIISQIDIDSRGNIKLTLVKPYTRLDIELTSLRIFPAHIWNRVDNPRGWKSPLQFTGCGPFVMNRVDMNSGVVSMVRNPFWKGQLPHLNRIELHMYHNLDVLSLAMKRGDIDTYYKYADTFPYENIVPIEETGFYKIKTFPQTGFVFLGFNLKEHPVDDLSLRQAILYSLDFKEIKNLITRNFGGTPTRGLVPPYFNFFSPTAPLARDINRARSILKESGYRDVNRDRWIEDPDKNPVELKLISTPLYIRLSELVKDYLDQIGIRVLIQVLDPVTWIHVKDRYDYHLTISRTTPWGMMMHAGWSTGYFDFRRSGQGVLHTIEDPYYTGLCDAALATKDPARLNILARNIQQYHATRIPAIALLAKTDVVPSKLSLTGWYYDPLFGIYNLRTILNLKWLDVSHPSTAKGKDSF